jgi:tetratricopeptide (TPR) repeat protein
MEIFKNRIFQQAIEAVRKGYGEEAVRLFNVLYNNYPFEESIIIYLGYSYYLLGDIKKALKFWEKLEKISSDKVYINLLLAFANAKLENIEDAIFYWLNVLKIDPSNKKAKYMLDFLKRTNSTKYFCKIISFKNAVGSLPYYNKYNFLLKLNKKNIKIFIFIILGIICFSLISLSIYNFYFSVYKIFGEKNDIENINTNYLPIDKNIKNKDFTIFYNSEREIEKDFDSIKYYISTKNYNGVIFLVNKINLSNAKYLTKEKARRYLSFINEPTYYDNISIPTYDEIYKSPQLYLNCYVKWKGIINDLDKKNNVFKLLVYEKSDIYIKGIIRCFVDNSSFLFNNIKVDIFAKFISFDENFLNFEIKFIKIIEK